MPNINRAIIAKIWMYITSLKKENSIAQHTLSISAIKKETLEIIVPDFF